MDQDPGQPHRPEQDREPEAEQSTAGSPERQQRAEPSEDDLRGDLAATRRIPVPEDDVVMDEARRQSVAKNEKLDGTANLRVRSRSPRRETLIVNNVTGTAERGKREFSATAFLVIKARSKEIDYGALPPEKKKLWDEAMAKEWTTWGNNQAAKLLSDSEVAALPKNLKVVGMRWVFAVKNERLRVPGTASASKAIWAKARLVVQGCQERVDIESYSPTASLTAIFFICALAAVLHLNIGSADAESAYLQGEKIQRMLILRAPRPPPPSVALDALLRA